MMRITLIARGILSSFFPAGQKEVTVDVPDDATVSRILKEIGVNPDFVSFVIADGQVIQKDDVPQTGAVLQCVPPVSGG